MKDNMKSQLLLASLASLTLGLAPFGEPHIIGKIKWVWGGARGMKPMDWFDLLLHGTPWVYLFTLLLILAYRKFKKTA